VFEKLKHYLMRGHREQDFQERLSAVRGKLPVPVFWLFGKTQSGKTSLVKHLTGAERAEIGTGYKPCTRFSQRYDFPTQEAPLLSFIDTRGMDEPGDDPAEDLARLNDQAHVVLVTVKVLDHAQENMLRHLQALRKAQPQRPVVLVLTCLHEAYPQQQHPSPYPFDGRGEPLAPMPALPENLLRSVAEQRRRFSTLVDRVVPVDLTPTAEGFHEPEYGGAVLRQTLIDVLPAALAQTLRHLSDLTQNLRDGAARQALPRILGYSSLAATAGALPIPFVDLLLLSGIQTHMVYALAALYGQPLSGKRFLELAGTLGLGVLVRQAGREALKLIPGIGTVLGSVAGGVLAGASTYALGQAFCYYYSAVQRGHVPPPEELRRYYQDELARAERAWQQMFRARSSEPEAGS
jgi:uncharacterized protein (DUF697 family)/predicted GTPase